MKKIPVIYWSGTGNTKMMAEEIAKAVDAAGAEAVLLEVGDITPAEAAAYPAMALGCPAMGIEVLEEYEFEPFFTELEALLSGKKIGLFGSYGWGGSYMQEWETRVSAAGGIPVAEGVLALNAPDEEALKHCRDLGKALAEA